jgi:hypothetical protein
VFFLSLQEESAMNERRLSWLRACSVVAFVWTVSPAVLLPAQVAGLDGAVYSSYRPGIIQSVQKALKERGLYAGPMNGILDKPTMKSIYEFQAANNLQRCGIPTPHTRRMLEQGSHTDLTFRSKGSRERNAPYVAVRSRNVSG